MSIHYCCTRCTFRTSTLPSGSSFKSLHTEQHLPASCFPTRGKLISTWLQNSKNHELGRTHQGGFQYDSEIVALQIRCRLLNKQSARRYCVIPHEDCILGSTATASLHNEMRNQAYCENGRREVVSRGCSGEKLRANRLKGMKLAIPEPLWDVNTRWSITQLPWSQKWKRSPFIRQNSSCHCNQGGSWHGAAIDAVASSFETYCSSFFFHMFSHAKESRQGLFI